MGNLWSSTGTKLATATFANETASGWQQVNFTTPVSITAGTVYVASYLAPSGHYAADSGFFATAGVDNAPLHALKDGVSGGNGVYAYGTSSTFPSNSFGAANYWVDVVYATGATTAPGAADRRDGDGRERVGDGELDGAVERREHDHQLHGDAVHRDDGADADHGDR